MNESAMILSAIENRLRAGSVLHTKAYEMLLKVRRTVLWIVELFSLRLLLSSVAVGRMG